MSRMFAVSPDCVSHSPRNTTRSDAQAVMVTCAAYACARIFPLPKQSVAGSDCLLISGTGAIDLSHDEDTFYRLAWCTVAPRVRGDRLRPADAAEPGQLYRSKRVPTPAVSAIAGLRGGNEGEHSCQRSRWNGGGIQRARRSCRNQGTTVGQTTQGEPPTQPYFGGSSAQGRRGSSQTG